MKNFLLAAVFASALVANAQSPETIHRCSSTEYMRQLQENFPEEYAVIKQAEEQAAAYAASTTTYKTNGGVYTIPVVVHVVYKGASQNIDDEFIYSQIDILNADYRRLNEDADETPAAFEGDAADAQIEFCLAQQDEDGITTTGITRTETEITSWDLFTGAGADDYADNVKFTDKGGEDAWSRSSYLNIWVCNLAPGVLGYATPPGAAPLKDGVVICYKYFGDNSPGGVYDKGRTTTHEVGHWLGLFHTWGDDDDQPEPQCGGSDLISDTPNQEDATYGAPPFPKLDDCSPTSPGIQFMNYMDYADDGSMNMFTQNQVNKMRDVLESSRASILESTGCEPGGVGVNSILKNQLIQLTVYPNPSEGQFVFEVKNFENENVTFEIYNMTGELIDRMILQNAPELHISFDGSNLSAGNYFVKASDGEFTLTQKITIAK